MVLRYRDKAVGVFVRFSCAAWSHYRVLGHVRYEIVEFHVTTRLRTTFFLLRPSSPWLKGNKETMIFHSSFLRHTFGAFAF
jgi:hypothetical protein